MKEWVQGRGHRDEAEVHTATPPTANPYVGAGRLWWVEGLIYDKESKPRPAYQSPKGPTLARRVLQVLDGKRAREGSATHLFALTRSFLLIRLFGLVI